jgi:phosphoserine phosphatase RsbU/P
VSTAESALLQTPTTSPAPAALPVIRRALIVEDDEGFSALLRDCFDGIGFLVERASDAYEGLALLPVFRPDLVILDVGLPGMSGLEVLSEIRTQELDMAVVVTTGLNSEDTAIEALRLGADDYLRKPFDLADFRSMLDRTAGRLQLRRQNVELWRHIEKQSRQLERELARAAEVQADLLPASYPELPDFDIAATCLPANEVGGDFYDWQLLPSGMLSITVGDVMGKGMSAALLMATVRAVMRAVIPDCSPAQAVQRTAQALDGDLTRSRAFITLFHAQLDPATGRVQYVDAGHGYAVVRRADGSIRELTPWGLPLGIDSHELYREGSIVLGPGDTMIMYSDGVTEARPHALLDRMAVAACAATGTDAMSIVRNLMSKVGEVRPLPDDLTVVVLRRQPVAAAA